MGESGQSSQRALDPGAGDAADRVRRLEIRRLDLAERNLWEKLEAAGTTAQRLSAANGLLDISERRAKLLGLDRAG